MVRYTKKNNFYFLYFFPFAVEMKILSVFFFIEKGLGAIGVKIVYCLHWLTSIIGNNDAKTINPNVFL